MPIDPKILALLVCPETRQALRVADADTLARVNERIQRGELKNRTGQIVNEPMREALIREDNTCLYRVDDSIPNLLVDEQISLPPAG